MSFGEFPHSPYRGLTPFSDSELDAFFFFGRERESELIAANIVAAKLTVLYGPSGVGKSSVLRAGVVRRLRALPGAPAAVVFDEWSDEPAPAIAAAVAAAVGAQPSATLVETVERAAAERGELYLILDQHEEYFLYHRAADDPFAEALAEIVDRGSLRVHVCIGIRDDALAQLDVFKPRIPSLFANYLRLDRLDLDSGRSAVVGPLERWNELAPNPVEIEPEVVEAVLADVTEGRLAMAGSGRGEARVDGGPPRVETAYLQLVMQRLWDAEREEGSQRLRLETFRRLGGAGRIVQDHLERALEQLSERERDAAAAMFEHLVTPSGTKIAQGSGDLAQYAGTPVDDLRPVLRSLAERRILRPVAGDGAGDATYEIFHDVLADSVLDWRTRHVAERALERELSAARRRQRRLLLVALVSLVALAAMAAVAIYALAQRSQAHEQERSARAGELSARALVQLDIDPQQSLEWALSAAVLDPTPQAEVVLRRALVAARLRRVLQVGAPVALVSYSPDGAEVLLGKSSGGAMIWDARRRRVVRTLDLDGAPVAAAAYDRSGKRLLTAQGRSVVVWDRSGARLATIEHRTRVADASFSADGSRVVSASADGAVRISRARDGVSVRVLHQPGPARRAVLSPDGRALVVVASDRAGHVQSRLYRGARLVRILDERGVGDVGFSPDGKVLATSNYDGSTHIWNARTGKPLRTFDDEGGAVVDVDFSPDGSLLATASSDGGVRVWRLATGDRFFYFTGHTSPLVRVVFDPTGTFVVSTSVDRSARIWQTTGIEAGNAVGLLIGHRGAVLTAAFSPDGRSIVTGSTDGSARIWDGRIEERLLPVGRFRGRVVDAEFSPDGRSVVAGDSNGIVRVLRPDGRGAVASVREPAPATNVAFSPDGKLVVSGAANGKVSLWSSAGRVAATLRGDAPLVRVRFSPDARIVAAAGGRTLRLWRTPTGDPLMTLRQPAPVTDVAISGDLAATGAADGVVRIWDLRDGRLLHALTGHEGAVTRVAFSPDGEVLASGGVDTTARTWSADGKALHVLRGHSGALTDVRFNPTGTRLVTTGSGSAENAMVWDVRAGRRVHDLVGHFGTVSTAGFSFDGRWIVTAGPISAVIWNAETGRLLFYLRGHTDLLTSATFSPQGYEVLTSARDGTVRIFDCELCVPLDSLITLARARIAVAH